jgi:hypothetical protein
VKYRRDVPRDDQEAIDAETGHVRAHLSACCDPDDDETALAEHVTVTVVEHPDGHPYLVSIVGEIDAEPDAPYLRDDYDPDAEPPVEFTPWEDPESGFRYDREAFAAWRAR